MALPKSLARIEVKLDLIIRKMFTRQEIENLMQGSLAVKRSIDLDDLFPTEVTAENFSVSPEIVEPKAVAPEVPENATVGEIIKLAKDWSSAQRRAVIVRERNNRNRASLIESLEKME